MAIGLDLTLSGLALGSAYALVAMGFVLILNATSSVNFAQGDLVVAGGYLAIALTRLLPDQFSDIGVLTIPALVIGTAIIGLCVSAIVYFPLAKRPPTAIFVSTIALGIILQNAFLQLSGPEARVGPALLGPVGQRLTASDLSLPLQDIAVILTAFFAAFLLHRLLYSSQFGRRMRAAASDPEMARAVGVRVTRMIAVSFALAVALAGLAGLLLSHRYFVSPGDGSALMLKAYIAVTLGGWGRLWGAGLGAFIVAGFEIGVAWFVGFPIAEIALYCFALLVLMVRPQGIFGEPEGRRV